MKKYLFLGITRASLLCSLAVVLLFTACSTDNTSKSTEVTSSPKWEEQLQYGLNLSKQRGDDQLRLLSYEYLGKVRSEEEMMALTDEIFADCSYTVISNLFVDGHIEYEFTTWAELRKDYKYAGLKVRDDIRNEDIVINQTDVIELTWSYKGNIYRSKAIASHDNGIIYDNISTYANSSSTFPLEPAETAESSVEYTDTRTVNANPATVRFQKTFRGTNEIGILQWSASFDCSSKFDENGIFLSASMSAIPLEQRGWVCDAKIRTLHGTPNVSDYHTFAWGYAYRDDRGSAYLTESGNGYDISYGAMGETGTVTHRHPDFQ